MEIFKKEVKIPEELSNYIELLHYEFECYKDLIHIIMIDNEKYSYNVEIYKQFMTEYKQAKKAYMLTINELRSMYAPEILDTKNITVKVDFDTNIVTIQQGGDTDHGQSCYKCS